MAAEPHPIAVERMEPEFDAVADARLRRELEHTWYVPRGVIGWVSVVDHRWRCRQTGEERAVDPRLYETLSTIYDHFGKPIELNSGFRYQRNEGSRHFHGSAMDITIKGVNYTQVYAYATTLDPGGMGIGKYPRSDFVHIDFRAPGEPSYRWTDTHGSGNRDAGKLPSKMWKRSSRPNT